MTRIIIYWGSCTATERETEKERERESEWKGREMAVEAAL